MNETEYSGQNDEVNVFAGLDRIKEEGTSSDRWERERETDIETSHSQRRFNSSSLLALILRNHWQTTQRQAWSRLLIPQAVKI